MQRNGARPPGMHRTVPSCLPLLLWLLGTAALWAQDYHRDVPIAPLRLTDTGGELGFEFDYLGETQERGHSGSLEFSNRSFEEYVLYRLNGYIYHPLFMDFRTRFKLGFLQQLIERSGGGSGQEGDIRSNALLREYDVYFTLFKESPVSLDFFARRERDAVRQLFTDRYLVETETYGGSVSLKKGPFPMVLSLRQNRTWEDGFDSHSRSASKILEYVARNTVSDRMRTELRYRYQDYEQNFEAANRLIKTRRDTSFRSHDLSLENTASFGSDRDSYLRSLVRLFTESNDQDLQNLYWQERLQLQHTPALRSYYLLNYLRSQVRNSTIQTYQAETGLDHRLYRSLDTHIDAHWRRSEFSGAADTYQGVTGRADYRKNTPWGHLAAGYGVTVDDIERTGASRLRTVLDETITLVPSIPRFLANPNINLASIVVTDLAGQATYDEGFDYAVEVRGNRTGLRLILGGRINDGESVLVDYDYESPTDVAYLSTSQAFNARYDFERYLKGLGVYYRWHNVTPSGGVEHDDPGVLRMTSNLVGASYVWRGLTWTEEFERYTSNFTSYDQLRSQIEGSHTLTPSLQWTWHAGILNMRYDNEERTESKDYTNALYAGTGLRGGIRGEGYWELEARGRKETGITDEVLLGVLGKIGMRWRKFRLSAGARIEERERFDSNRDRVHVFLQVSREF